MTDAGAGVSCHVKRTHNNNSTALKYRVIRKWVKQEAVPTTVKIEFTWCNLLPYLVHNRSTKPLPLLDVFLHSVNGSLNPLPYSWKCLQLAAQTATAIFKCDFPAAAVSNRWPVPASNAPRIDCFTFSLSFQRKKERKKTRCTISSLLIFLFFTSRYSVRLNFAAERAILTQKWEREEGKEREE